MDGVRTPDKELADQLYKRYRPFLVRLRDVSDAEDPMKCDLCGGRGRRVLAVTPASRSVDILVCFENGCASLLVGREAAAAALQTGIIPFLADGRPVIRAEADPEADPEADLWAAVSGESGVTGGGHVEVVELARLYWDYGFCKWWTIVPKLLKVPTDSLSEKQITVLRKYCKVCECVKCGPLG